MKFDLEKELGFDTRRTSVRWPWLAGIAALCVLNLLLAVVALWRGRPAAPAAVVTPGTNTVVIVQNTQSLVQIDLRMNDIEASLRELQTDVRQSSKDMAAVNAQKEIQQRRERIRTRDLEKQGVDPDEIRQAARNAQVARQPVAELTDSQRTAFDALIDSDATGERVQSFLRELNSDAQLRAYLAILRDKGDQWLDAGMALAPDSEDFEAYVDNARYFYNIIASVSSDSSAIAYVEAKRTQIQLALQNRRLQAANAERTARTQEEIAALEERLKPKETAAQAQQRLVNERRQRYIKDYPASGAVKPYPTDWDPDPRVREERGIE